MARNWRPPSPRIIGAQQRRQVVARPAERGGHAVTRLGVQGQRRIRNGRPGRVAAQGPLPGDGLVERESGVARYGQTPKEPPRRAGPDRAKSNRRSFDQTAAQQVPCPGRSVRARAFRCYESSPRIGRWSGPGRRDLDHLVGGLLVLVAAGLLLVGLLFRLARALRVAPGLGLVLIVVSRGKRARGAMPQ